MKNIVFVHGMFMNPKSWQGWIQYFERLGYSCKAPAYPFHEGEPAELRNKIPIGLGRLTLPEVLGVFRKMLKEFETKPILIGHSMGGAVTQMMVHEGLASAGVCIDSAPVGGLFSTKWSFLKSNLPVINPFKGDSPFLMTYEQFQYTFCNTMTLEETKKAFDAFVVAESRNLGRTANGATKIDFAKPHAPLLFIAGEKDNIIPHSLNEKNWKSYKDKNSVADFKLFSGRTHYICGQQGWEEVAAYVADWLSKTV
jgi:pimeloyl-ACP methyl ester carboxylesterase